MAVADFRVYDERGVLSLSLNDDIVKLLGYFTAFPTTWNGNSSPREGYYYITFPEFKDFNRGFIFPVCYNDTDSSNDNNICDVSYSINYGTGRVTITWYEQVGTVALPVTFMYGVY